MLILSCDYLKLCTFLVVECVTYLASSAFYCMQFWKKSFSARLPRKIFLSPLHPAGVDLITLSLYILQDILVRPYTMENGYNIFTFFYLSLSLKVTHRFLCVHPYEMQRKYPKHSKQKQGYSRCRRRRRRNSVSFPLFSCIFIAFCVSLSSCLLLFSWREISLSFLQPGSYIFLWERVCVKNRQS